MRLLLAFLLLLPLRLLAAVGDITGAEVETNGWVIKLYISGLNTNGNFFNGFGTNNSLTATNALTLTLDSMGFNDAGEGIIRQRTVYGTKLLRMPYPSQLTNDIATDGDGCIPRIALSEYVYASDSNLTLTVLAGGYAVTNGDGTNCTLTTALATTNGSTQPYPKVIANWSWPPDFDVVTNYADLRVVGIHASAENGKPLACVKFWAHGLGAVKSGTNIVTQATINKSLGDANPVIEYCTSLDYTGLSSSNLVTNYFAAYPWIGDSASVVDCSDNVNASMVNPLYRPMRLLNNSGGEYKMTFAHVDHAIGNDTTGKAATTYDPASPPAPFLHIGMAARSIQDSNNSWYGRNNTGLGVIYITNGSHPFRGATPGIVLSSGQTYIMVAGVPGSALGDCMIDSVDNAGQISHRLRLRHLLMRDSGSDVYFSGNYELMWFDKCIIDQKSSQPIVVTNMYYTQCAITNLRVHANGAGGAGCRPALIRGNAITNDQCTLFPFTVVGNTMRHTNIVRTNIILYITRASVSFANPVQDNLYIGHNAFYGGNQGAGIAICDDQDQTNIFHGVAWVQNLFEGCVQYNGSIMELGGGKHGTNVLFFNNTSLGGKNNMFYNDTGTDPIYAYHHHFLNNYWDDWNIKSDTFDNGTDRIGNWPVLFGVGSFAQIQAEITNVGAPGDFCNYYCGISGFPETAAVSPNQTSWPGFVDRKCYVDTDAWGAGDGDYRLRSDSVLFRYNTKWALPYDIEGLPRGLSDPPGAFSSGNVRKGCMF